MPIDLELIPSRRIARVTLTGSVTNDEVSAAAAQMKSLIESNNIASGWVQLVDTSSVADLNEISRDVLRDVAQRPPWPADLLRVIIAPTDISFGLARMYELLAGEKRTNLHVVRSMDEADALIQRSRETDTDPASS